MAIVKESTSVPRSDAIPLGMLAAGWLSVQDPSLSVLDVSKALIRDVLTSHQDKSLVDALQRLGALRTVRAFSRQKTAFVEPVATESSALITLRKGEVWWNDLRLGILVTIFQNIMPQEAQARLSYDTFRYRFLSWLEGHCGVLALDAEASDAMVILFVPDGVPAPDIPAEWQRFVTHAFSASELQQTFVLLLNSIALSSKGFSVPDVPIVTRDQADVLVALFYATLQNIALRLKRYEQELQEETVSIDSHKQGSEEQTATVNKIKKRKEQLETQHKNYDQALAWMKETFEQLRNRDAERALRIQTLARSYTPIARRQLNPRKDIIEKAVTRTKELLMLSPDAFFTIPPLLSYEAPAFITRNAGDAAEGVCYACGSLIGTGHKRRKEARYKANKLILQRPSQTLQGYLTQTEPEICPTCTALALACPIKMADSGLVISLYERDVQRKVHYLYEHRLRMLTTGEQNITAGRYLMIPCNEKGPQGKPLIGRIGGLEYALLKVASLFPVDVLTRFEVEGMFGTDTVQLKQRYLVALRYLLEAFTIRLDTLTDYQHYTAVADAIRYVERDSLVFAIYRLMVGLQQQSTYSNVQRVLLEDGLAAYKKGLHMDGELKLEQRFRDIAGLTGVLYAFVSRMKSELTKASQGSPGTTGGTASDGDKQRDRELKKLIEQVDNPNRFTYEAAGALSGQMAQLWRSQHIYFIYDEAKRLLQEAQVDISERETVPSQGEPSLKLFYDDINKIYTILYERNYTTEKARRDFAYELKLSLYSRFPDLRPGNQ